jgi:rhamnulose-1-phosphate aldolase
MSHVATRFDRIVEDIGEAGQQLTAMAACEGSAGNISVFVPSLSCPFDPVAEVDLPALVPSLAGGWAVITAGGRRLRDVSRRPELTIAALHIDDSGRTATLHAAPDTHPSSELNSHLAIHEDHRRRRAVDHHAVVHAQPLRLVFLSHLPDITTSAELTERLMRWEPETAVVAPDGIELAAFQVPGSPGQMDSPRGVAAEERIPDGHTPARGGRRAPYAVTLSEASARRLPDGAETVSSAVDRVDGVAALRPEVPHA